MALFFGGRMRQRRMKMLISNNDNCVTSERDEVTGRVIRKQAINPLSKKNLSSFERDMLFMEED